MQDLQRSSRIFQLANVVIVVCCLILLGIYVRASVRKHQDNNIKQQYEELKRTFNIDDLRVTNKTSGFEIAHLEKTSDLIIGIDLKNTYGKKITAYQISLGSTTASVEMLLSSLEQSIDPGATTHHVEGIGVDPDLYSKGLVILAVVFDDGTADGDAEAIKELNDYRKGEMMQMKQAVDLLTQAIDAPDNEIMSAFDRVKKTSVLPSSGSRKLDHVRFGAEDARKRMALQAERIMERNPGAFKSGVISLLNDCKNQYQQLSLYNEAVEVNSRSKVKNQ